MALFGEKYGDRVRVVSVGDWARELCGGTHAQRSGQVGLVKFLSEGSIGAGVRRVEAIVGVDAYRFLAREHLLIAQLSEIVQARPEELPERIDGALTRLKSAEREIASMRSASLVANIDGVIGLAHEYGDIRMWTFTAPEGTDAAGLRELVTMGRDKARHEIPSVVLGAAVLDGKVSLVAATNDAGRVAGQSANRVLQAALAAVGGRGGGKDDMAQGGGTDVTQVEQALAAAQAVVRGTPA
jgi:alanyl-tRNA synthetase